MEFDPGALQEALGSAPASAWSLPSDITGNGVHHGYRRLVLVGAGVREPAAAAFGFVLDAFDPVHTSWISWIDPGGYIRRHRDAGPWRERWQVPIVAAGEFHADESTRPADGVAFRVEHWKGHSVTNDTDRPRIHLIVDRDVWVDLPPLPFELYV